MGPPKPSEPHCRPHLGPQSQAAPHASRRAALVLSGLAAPQRASSNMDTAQSSAESRGRVLPSLIVPTAASNDYMYAVSHGKENLAPKPKI